MSSSFKFIDHTADIAVEVKADTIEELFLSSADSYKDAVVENDSNADGKIFLLTLDSPSLETLLVNFLSELNFRLNFMNRIFINIPELKIYKKDEMWYLECKLIEHFVDRNKILAEIKAVTYHQMEIKKDVNEYSTRIVFDI